MDVLRYFLAYITLVAFPPVIVGWLVAHLGAGFWRRLPLWATYSALGLIGLAVAAGIHQLREPLLAVEYGTSWGRIGLGLLFYAAAVFIEIRTRKLLSLETLVGVPELSGASSSQGVIREGIYRYLRHPRYLELILGVVALALISNYRSAYLFIPVWIAGIYLVTVAEERELIARFGDDYREYRRQTPRLFPRWPGRA